MKNLSIILMGLWLLSAAAKAQHPPDKSGYTLTTSEMIFSSGTLKNGNMKIDPVIRFSGFFHFQNQFHFDLNDFTGIYTGIGIRNIGFINKLNDSVRIKQRSYSLGIPFAFKFGNMKDKIWFAAGAEAELMFAYKQKVFYGGQKFKNYKWFSDKVNLFNPGLFAEIHFKDGVYIRAKYYLFDFLKEDKQEIKLFGIPYDFTPEESKLFYISIGKTITPRKALRKKGKIKTGTVS
ncbi:MAG: hypothetical protein LC117_02055 [Bacteroidia bacterium]|nr:hypothetical protein [Bacteroidia bacterium]MCZ2276699.1 hypothetical protein [Bacteroidia bacterium]